MVRQRALLIHDCVFHPGHLIPQFHEPVLSVGQLLVLRAHLCELLLCRVYPALEGVLVLLQGRELLLAVAQALEVQPVAVEMLRILLLRSCQIISEQLGYFAERILQAREREVAGREYGTRRRKQ